MRIAILILALTVPAFGQWTLQESHTTASLRGIHSLGNGVAWASGSHGTVLRTVDGGKNWQPCAVPPGAEKLDFRGVQGFDGLTAIVMSIGKGDLSRIYKTADGCKTWELLFTNPDKEGFWDGMVNGPSLESKMRGWILGDPVDGRFRVFKVDLDTGTAIQADDTDTLAAPDNAGAFAASNSSFFVLKDGPLLPNGPLLPPPPNGTKREYDYEMAHFPVQYFVTGGGGGARIYVRQPDWYIDFPIKEEWKSYPLPLGDGSAGSGAFSVMLRSLTSGVAVGGDYSKPDSASRTAAYRDPATLNWLAAAVPPHGYRSAVVYDAAGNAWITVGPNGTDISTDDGRNWHPLLPGTGDAPDSDKHWNALSLPFVVGEHGRIGILRGDALVRP